MESFQYGCQGFCPCVYIENANSADLLLVPTSDSVVKVINRDTKTITCKLVPSKGDKVYGMCMSIKKLNSETDIFVGYEDGSVSLWDTLKKEEVTHLSLHENPVMSMDFSPVLNKGITGSTGRGKSFF